MVSSIVGQPFSAWVNDRVEDRNKTKSINQDLLIQLDPRIAAAFEASTHVSTATGVSAHLMKASAKRRRSKIEILEAKATEAEREQSIMNASSLLLETKEELRKAKEEAAYNSNFKNVLDQMVESGQVKRDENNNFSIIENSELDVESVFNHPGSKI